MRSILIAGLIGVAACNGGKTDSSPGDTGTKDTGTAPAGGFSITGNVVNLDGTPAAEGLCTAILDPTPVIADPTASPNVLATGTVGAGGAISFDDIVTSSIVGILIDVRDCEGVDPPTVYPSATGIPAAAYAGLGDGDALADQTAYSIDKATADGLAGSATAAGFTGDLEASGFLFVFILDATGQPIDGATASCTGSADCAAPLYLDADPTDGAFTTAGAPNTATSAAAHSGVVFPGGVIAQYSADDGGAHTFTPLLDGTSQGVASFAAVIGQ